MFSQNLVLIKKKSLYIEMTMAASLKDTWGQPLLFLRGCTNLIKNLGENNMPRFFRDLTKVATLTAPVFFMFDL